jgi:hypothetical protein
VVVTRPLENGFFRVSLSHGDDFAYRCHETYLKTQFNEKSIKKILNIQLRGVIKPQKLAA